MLQAITTKFIGPTKHQGPRIKATCEARSITFNCQEATQEKHTNAARLLATRMGWEGYWYGGVLPDGNGYCYVLGPTIDDNEGTTEPEFIVVEGEL